MKVSREFLKLFAELANRYGWTHSEIEEIKQETRLNPGLKKYWEILSKAHRAGYVQNKGNGHIRLKDWCREKGLDNPYSPSFDPRVLDLS